MKELVIGGDGFIGSRLMQLAECEGTSRKNPTMTHMHPLDLFELKNIPETEIAYICVGVNGAMVCEGNQDAHRLNVDATVNLAKILVGRGTFVVWISSTTVEWSNSAYARQKMLAETMINMMPNTGVVRAGRVLESNRDGLCQTMMQVGRERIPGITLWGIDEQPYQK